jgi:hypothetical protein
VQATQPRELNKEFYLMPLKQKSAKAVQSPAGDPGSATTTQKLRKPFTPRNKNIQPHEPKKTITCHHRSNKKLRKPNKKPRKSKAQIQQKAAQPRRETKRSTARAQQSIIPYAAQTKNRESPTADPKSATQKQKFQLASSTKIFLVTTVPTKTVCKVQRRGRTGWRAVD